MYSFNENNNAFTFEIFFMNQLKKLYELLILDRPIITIFLVIFAVGFLSFHAQHFRLDASSESLALENDAAVKYYRAIKARYGSDEYLAITYTPKTGALFEEEILSNIQALQDDLLRLPRIETVTSILNVPLVQSPPITLEELAQDIRTLSDEDTDRALAQIELQNSLLYKDMLISKDGKTAALFVTFQKDEMLDALFETRSLLREKAMDNDLRPDEKKTLKAIEQQYAKDNAVFQAQWDIDVSDIRGILNRYRGGAHIYLGGVPMMVSDSISYIASDLKVFGGGLFAFLVILLGIIFRKARWVALPMSVCLCVGLCVIGFLGLMGWPVTIVSSNFIALLLIFTLSFNVHQIVRYRECVRADPQASQRDLVSKMLRTIGIPCAYMVFTTIVAFGSLVISDIRPIIDFGWMMAIGLIISFIISFSLFPALLMFFKPEKLQENTDFTEKLTLFFAHLVQRRRKTILAVFIGLIIFAGSGINMLFVQNSFMSYFKKGTDIYQGMQVIDTQLGGTTPLDIIINAPQDFIDFQREEAALMEEEGFGSMGGDPILEGYWFSDILMEDAAKIHGYLEDLPETGKVLSFYTTVKMLQDLKDASDVDRFYLGVLYNKLPQDVKNLLFKPYISDDGNQLRFSIRIYESMEGLDRQKLLDQIHHDLSSKFGLQAEQIQTTGMVVLYNNVLQTLFQSQILTIWVVFVTMFVIFIALFRNIKIAAVAIIPNVTVTALVLGLMGWLGIPLDIMTITIAAIAFGAADDNTIHYVHRMMREYKRHGNYWQAVKAAHTTIGRAVYYTSITVILGFSVLALSSFVPTIYFGLLTGFAMLAALLANLVLLPLLIVLFKPFGQEKPA